MNEAQEGPEMAEPTGRAFEVTGANLIAGRDSRAGSHTFYSVDPRTGEPGTVAFSSATREEVDAAACSAAEASKVLRALPTAKIGTLLRRIADRLDEYCPLLVEQAELDTGLSASALTREMQRTTWQFRAFAEVVESGWHLRPIIDLPDPDFIPVPRPDLRRMLAPVGPVAVFAASNVPFAFGVSGGDTASALAAGCAVVVKGHQSHPSTSELLARVISEAINADEAPKGMFSLLQGDQEDVGAALVTHPLIKAVGFTGSFRGGKALFDLAVRRSEPIVVYAEMGSTNPVFVTPAALDARAEQLGQAVADAITVGNGQFCTKPGVVAVPDGPARVRFEEALGQRLLASSIGPLLNQKIFHELESDLREIALIEGVTESDRGVDVEGALGFTPRVLVTSAGVLQEHSILREEHFGPVVILASYSNEEQLLELATAMPNSLTATIQAEDCDVSLVRDLEEIVTKKAGRIIYNGIPTGVAVTHAMQHGGPFPATTDSSSTSVGSSAIFRFLRPVTFQNYPEALLPPALQSDNPLHLERFVNGVMSADAIAKG